VVFVSDRTGTPTLWKVNTDGTGLLQLTFAEDYQPAVSPDGKWVYYDSWAGGNRNVWRVPFEGGTPEKVLDNPSANVSISPGGKLLACFYQASAGSPFRIAVLPVAGEEPVAIFDMASPSGTGVQWAADGQSLLYLDQEAGAYNVYAKPINGDRSRRVTQFESGVIYRFALSRDGGVLACARGTRNSDVVLIRDAR
jgi:TolB protein